MYAIAFDMEIAELKKNFNEQYNNAYFEIGKVLKNMAFSGHKEVCILPILMRMDWESFLTL